MERAPAKSFRDLSMWPKAHQFVLGVYRLTAKFPRQETYGLTAQLRRAAVSVPANIAEGFKKRGRPDKARYMNTAEASLEECRYYLLLSKDLSYGEDTSVNGLAEEVARLLAAYSRTLLAPQS
jgi:four helix bundle protein